MLRKLILSELMDSLFKTLIKNILLTEHQEEDAQTKYNGVCSTLHNYYYKNIKYDGSTKLLIGSYGKSTNIRPPRDVDVIFKMPDSEFERFNSLSGNKQSQLLQEARSILKDAYTTTEKIKAFGKVVAIEFADGTHNIELLPAWQLADGKFRIPNTENDGSWEIYDPIAEINHIRSSNKRTGKTLDLIRVCKKWTENCNVPLKSFIVENLVVKYLNELNERTIKQEYASLVAGFFKFLLSKVNTTIFTATGEAIGLGGEWESRTESADQRASKALEYENSGEMVEASEEWEKVFGDDFPKFEKSVGQSLSIVEKITNLAKLYPSAKEEYLERNYGIRFATNPIYELCVDARVTQDGFRSNWLSAFLQRGIPLKKQKELLFSVVRNTVPAPYSLMWKVRNFGDEAKGADDLRGEITYDKGFENKKERTRYHGEHYVECFAIKEGACVALGRILVPIGKY